MTQKFKVGDIVIKLNGKKPAQITHNHGGYQSYGGYYSCKYLHSGRSFTAYGEDMQIYEEDTEEMAPKISIGREQAIQFYNTEWWKERSYLEIAFYQLFTVELMCPFDVFHEAVEKSLGRPVFTHEFGLNYDGLCQEFLGERSSPSLQEILNLIPQNK